MDLSDVRYPRMHPYDPGNIEHLYLVTFPLQQLFTR